MKNFIYIVSLILVSSQGFAAGSGDHSHKHEHGHTGNMFAVGEPVNGNVDRTVSVSMLDSMRFEFSPRLDKLKNGESIRFIVSNDGKIQHEFTIGNAEEQKAHAEMMRQMSDMHHEDPNAVSLEPGQKASLAWRFKGKDTVVFACNIPGHFEAGMHHSVKISN